MGTCGHQIAAEVLGPEQADLASYLNREMWFKGREEYWRDQWPYPKETPQFIHKVDQALLDAVEVAVAFVRERAELTGGILEVEQRVPIGHFTGEGDVWIDPDTGDHVPKDTPGAQYIETAGGTSDVVLIYGETIETIDFKFGRHKVDAFDTIEPARGEKPPVRRINLQLGCYILGAYRKFDWYADFKFYKATIVQPFLEHVSEHSGSIDELLQVQAFLKEKADETRTNPVYAPDVETCHYCKAKGDCAAQTAKAVELALDGFGDVPLDQVKAAPVSQHILGDLYAVTAFVQEWAQAVEDRVFEALNAGQPVVRSDGLRYCFVTGRKGNRKWDDEQEIEEMLKHFRLRKDEMYKFSLISPADAEKLAKQKRGGPPPVLNTKQWETLQSRVTQSDGKKSIALETDSRPQVASSAEGFGDVPTEEHDFSDLGL